MIFKLRTKLALAFASVSIILVIVTGLLGKFMLENHFNNYVIQKQASRTKEIVSLISQQYEGDNLWRKDVIENIGVSALEQGLIVKVTDYDGKTVWDAKEHNNGMCQQMIQHMAYNMQSKYHAFNGSYTVNSYPLNNAQSKKVGTVEIGYYGPFYFTDEDLHFINALNTALLWAAVLALLLSVIIGRLLAKKISDPIGQVIHTAHMIEKGNYDKEAGGKTTTRELIDLIDTVNRLAQTLKEQENLRKRLTADVSHELRTPLATLQSHMEAMLDGIWEPTPERLKSCYDEIIRINKMVGDMQLLARYEADAQRLDKTEFDLGELAAGIIMNFESEFKCKGVGIELIGGGFVYADRDKLSQVIINLLSNGLKYTPPGGRVELEIAEKEKTTEITVKDNGAGIPPEDLPHIFERFYRADKSRSRLTGGAGIGLAVVKAIVDAHNGTVEVDSRLNAGTAFTVTLPKRPQ